MKRPFLLLYCIMFFYQYVLCKQVEANISHETEPFFERPYVFISLGEGCKTAGYIRGSNLTKYSYPFDWMLSIDFEAIYNIVQADFFDYMNIKNLNDLNFFDKKMNLFPDEPKNPSMRWVFETLYNIESRHDFTIKKSIPDAYESVMEKIHRRISRFYKTLQRTDITVFFVRLMVTKDQAIRFRNLIETKFPNLKFVFIALSNTNDFKYDWAEQKIRNFYFNDPVYRWNNTINNYQYNNGSNQEEWKRVVNIVLNSY